MGLIHAIGEVRDLDMHMWDDLGPHLTCHEANVLTDLLHLLGCPDQAAALAASHTDSDEPGDQHYELPYEGH